VRASAVEVCEVGVGMGADLIGVEMGVVDELMAISVW